MDDPPRRMRTPRQPRLKPIGPPGPPQALEEPIDIDRYQRHWRFVVTELGPAGGPRWMWEGPDGRVDARAFQPTSRRTEVIEALHFWVHDWAFFRGTRRLELGGVEWTARRASRGVLGGREPGDVPGWDDPAGIHFRSSGSETRFLPLEISGPDFVTMPRLELVQLLHRALGR
jgi:hypothetical protein